MAYIDPSKRLDWLSNMTQFDWAQHVMGKIDVDACANDAQVYKPAHCFYGQGEPGDADDGMTADWHALGDGKVYINPTWGERKPKAKKGDPPLPPMPCFYPLSRWIMKIHGEAGHGASVFFVGPAHTDRTWFHHYVARCSAFCLLQRRIEFRLPEMKPDDKSQPGQAHMAALWTRDGGELDRFCDLFDPLGLVVEPAA